MRREESVVLQLVGYTFRCVLRYIDSGSRRQVSARERGGECMHDQRTPTKNKTLGLRAAFSLPAAQNFYQLVIRLLRGQNV